MNGIDISMASTQKVQCKIANTLTEDYTVDDVENEVRNNAPCVFELTFGSFKNFTVIGKSFRCGMERRRYRT